MENLKAVQTAATKAARKGHQTAGDLAERKVEWTGSCLAVWKVARMVAWKAHPKAVGKVVNWDGSWADW